MTTFRQVEDIEAWKKARELVKKVYNITGSGQFAKDYPLRDQIRRASISVMSNIAEGYDRDGTKEFIQFLLIAKGSAGEVKTQLVIAADLGYLTQSEFNNVHALASETGKILAGLIQYLKGSSIKGAKFK